MPIPKSAPGALVLAIVWLGTANATDVAVCTDNGRFVIELADEQSPLTVANFLRYVDSGFYSGTVFHRVAPGFVVQAGGYDRGLRDRRTLPPVKNESMTNGLTNARGTIAAARSENPDSATSQFFVNLADNPSLDGDAPQTFGYTVFGRVKEGIELIDDIGHLPTGAKGQFRSEVPANLVAIRSATRIDDATRADIAALDTVADAARPEELKRRLAAADNPAAVLRAVALYHAVCAQPDSAVTLAEATAALATGEQDHAAFVLDDFLAVAEQTDPAYAQAVDLRRGIQPVDAAIQKVAGCNPPVLPVSVDAGTATLEQMTAGHTRVQEFVAAGEGYLACIAKIADDKARPAEDRNAAIAEHNRMVAAMERAAADFNVQIKIFKARPR